MSDEFRNVVSVMFVFIVGRRAEIGQGRQRFLRGVEHVYAVVDADATDDVSFRIT